MWAAKSLLAKNKAKMPLLTGEMLFRLFICLASFVDHRSSMTRVCMPWRLLSAQGAMLRCEFNKHIEHLVRYALNAAFAFFEFVSGVCSWVLHCIGAGLEKAEPSTVHITRFMRRALRGIVR